MEYLKSGAERYLELAKKTHTDVFDNSSNNDREMLHTVFEKHITNNIDKRQLEGLVFSIIIPVLLMIYTLSRNDTSFGLRIVTTCLVVTHIIISTKRNMI